MAKYSAHEYSKQIKRRLIDIDRSQAWLINEVATATGLYFDSSYLSKIMTGKINPPKIIAAINEILQLEPVAADKQESA